MSKDLLDSFENRIAQRRDTRGIQLLEYLSNPDFIFKKCDQFGVPINKSEITECAVTQIQRLYSDICIYSNDEESEAESKEGANTHLNLAQQLEEYVKRETYLQVTKSVGISIGLYVKREMDLYESRKKCRPEYRKNCIKAC